MTNDLYNAPSDWQEILASVIAAVPEGMEVEGYTNPDACHTPCVWLDGQEVAVIVHPVGHPDRFVLCLFDRDEEFATLSDLCDFIRTNGIY